MRIIISPAKTMQVNDKYSFLTLRSEFLLETKKIVDKLAKLPLEALKSELKCNEGLALKAYLNYKDFNYLSFITPAILMYNGLVFKHLSFETLTKAAQDYLFSNLYILSSLYGAARPQTLLTPYRLDFNNNLKLYEFWNDKIYHYLFDDYDGYVLNLASKEYSKLIKDYLNVNDKFIDVEFLVYENGKYLNKATISKMMRGKMLRFLALNDIIDVESVKLFNEEGFSFDETKSSINKLVFVQIKE